ncbi:MAG TPA: hypothetical protein VGL35_02455 [Rhizomicrobium sp.]|jgi:hypothetical protein
MRCWIGFVAALALAGCDTIGGIKYGFDSGSFSRRTNALAASCAARMQDRAFDVIRSKVELFKSPPDGPVPFVIQTDTTTPSPTEKAAIDLWAQTVERCQKQAHGLMDKIPAPPEATPSEVEKLDSYITDAWIEGSKLRVALYSGQVTYADYANRKLTLAEDALKTAERYAQDTDEENDTHDLEDVEIGLAPFLAMM